MEENSTWELVPHMKVENETGYSLQARLALFKLVESCSEVDCPLWALFKGDLLMYNLLEKVSGKVKTLKAGEFYILMTRWNVTTQWSVNTSDYLQITGKEPNWMGGWMNG